MSFDLDRLPRGEIVAAVAPGAAIPLNHDGHVRVRCFWPGCADSRHKNGDRSPSADFDPRTGHYICRTSGATASGWRELVEGCLGADAWKRWRDRCWTEGPRGARRPADLPALWSGLQPERKWSDLYRIDPTLSGRYLRSGRRLPGEVYSDSAIGIFTAAGELSGIKFRLPAGQRWKIPPKSGHVEDKYLCADGSKIAGVAFLGDRAAAHPGATIVVCAGEKDALVAASHLDAARWAPVSSCVGEGPSGLARSWVDALTPLARGRRVVIAYDDDVSGRSGAWRLAEALEGVAADVRAAVIDGGAPLPAGEERWDVAGLVLARGRGALEQALMLADPVPPEWKPAPPPPGKAEAARAQAPATGPRHEAGEDDGPPEDEDEVPTQLAKLALGRGELFRDRQDQPHICFPTEAGTRQVHLLRSSAVRGWLASTYFVERGTVCAPSAIEAALGVLAGLAAAKPPEDVHVRLANVGDRIYLDLGDDLWRVVEITAAGWQVLDRSPVRFRRRPGQLPLPVPVLGGSVDELWPLVNIPEERDWIMAKAWILGSLRGRGPFWIALLQGEQGSGKSTSAKILRNLLDPSHVPIRTAPKEDRDLLIAANASWVTCFDNLSGCPAWLSDSMCRLATGGGFSTRALYTDGEEALFWAVRPILLNGIDDLATRPDLADRSLLIRLPTIDKSARREEDDVLADFAACHARVLGAFLTAASCALRRRPEVRLASLPRMADAARWAVAGSPALGIPDSAIPELLESNRQEQDLIGLEADVVASAVSEFLDRRGGSTWSGTTRELLRELAQAVGDDAARGRAWPKSEAQLGGRLKRVAPVLRRLGVELRELRQGNERLRVLRRADFEPGEDERAG